VEKTIELSSSLEDYLEAIALLQTRRRAVRVKDVSQHLGVKASSVSGALQALSQKELIIHEHYGYIELTRKGEQLAQTIQRRHDTLLTFLTDILRIPQHVAAQEACAMEHHISNQTLERLSKFIAFAEPVDQGNTSAWLQRFHRIIASNSSGKNAKTMHENTTPH
jgi:DtxR family Mn-dependent transcriptional regulator